MGRRGTHPSSMGDWQWRQIRDRFRNACRSSNALCHICIKRGDIERAAIDYTAHPHSPLAFEADHIMPVRTHPHLKYSWENLAPAHMRCNRGRRHDDDGVLQQNWVVPDW